MGIQDKEYPDGTLKKFKALFCARSDFQKAGVDYFETWAPVVHWRTIRVIIVLAVKLGLLSVQCDITATFIHGRLPEHEEIYVHQPQGFYKGDRKGLTKCTLSQIIVFKLNIFVFMCEKGPYY
jgi:hypothetical protein